METETKKITAINALIEINNDRHDGYKTAADETKDSDLIVLFNRLSQQSRGFSHELQKFVNANEAKTIDETRDSGKLFRVWMELKAAITGKDRKAILKSCEFGEDVAKKTYDEILEDSDQLSPIILNTIRRHRAEIQKGHDTIKSLRDKTGN